MFFLQTQRWGLVVTKYFSNMNNLDYSLQKAEYTCSGDDDDVSWITQKQRIPTELGQMS